MKWRTVRNLALHERAMTGVHVACRRMLRAGVTLIGVAPAFAPALGRAQVSDTLASDTAVVQQDEGSSLIPLPVVFYQPETGVGFGATGVYLFHLGRTSGAEERRLPSSIAAVGFYTTKGQIITAVQAELYPAGGGYRYIGELSFSKFPTKLWGIGNDTAEELEEDYTPVSFNLTLEAQRRLRRGWYAGVTAQFGYRELKEVQDGGLIEGGLVPGSADGVIVGAGLLLLRDTRESTWYPRSSSFHQIRAMLFDGAFGSDYDYTSLAVDLRKYTPVFAKHVLALRGLGFGISGDPPFDLLPQLGGDVLLRGYYQGRYRDKDLLAFQAEYRAPIWWKLGAVGFVSAGQVAPELSGLRFDALHPAAGFGLRFLIQEDEGVQIRADYAWGFDVESSGFYINIGEAF
jgi:hypothetical protein